jgi:hypothetical protein
MQRQGEQIGCSLMWMHEETKPVQLRMATRGNLSFLGCNCSFARGRRMLRICMGFEEDRL